MEDSKIRSLIRKHSVEYIECSKKGIYVNELYVDEFTEELIFELNQERAKEKDEQSASDCNLHVVSVPKGTVLCTYSGRCSYAWDNDGVIKCQVSYRCKHKTAR